MLEKKTDLVPVYTDDPVQLIDVLPTRQVKLKKMPEFIKTAPKSENEFKTVADIPLDVIELKKTENEITLPNSEPPMIQDSVSDDPIEFIDLSEIPVLKSAEHKIKYPSLARMANIEGIVSVKVLIDKEGNVKKSEILKSIGGGCDEEALEYVSSMKFKPGTQRDKPVSVWVVIPVKFQLKSR